MRITRRGLLSRGAALLAVALGAAAVPVPAAAAAPVSGLPHAVGGYVQSPVLQKVRGAHATADLPVSVDLRSYAPPPGDQGQIGSCVSWTIAHQIMGYYANRQAGVGAPYAPLYLYMRTVAPGGAPSAGTNPDNALNTASSGGVDTQEHYFQGTTGWQTPPTADEVENAKKYRVSGWQRLWVGGNQGANAQTAVKEALASGQPVAIGFPVYKDFMSLRSHTNYTTTSGTSLGGHMVALMGYDATGVIIRNSWGGSWGNAGDAHLSWSFVQTAVNGAYTVSGISTPASQVELTPSVASLSAKTGPATGGTAVTITGSGLSTATSVRFGATSAQFTSATSGGVTKLVATSPAGTSGSTVDVTVTNGAGTSATGTGTKFAYTPAGPSVSAVSPLSTVIYGGATVTLTGADLVGVRSVTVGTRTVSYKAAAGGASLTFVAPAQAAGAQPVKVTTSYGTSTPVTLTYVPPNAPAVTATSTTTASTFKATPITITGTNLLKATMSLGGKAVSGAVTDTKITVSLPARPAGDLPLTVTTAGGVATITVSYVAPAKPVLSVPAATGLTYKAAQVTVEGSALADATAVTLGSQKLSFTKVSATQLKVTFPMKAAGGYDLRVTTPGGTSDPVTFSYVAPARPVIAALSATSGPEKKTITITLTGTALTDASAVTLGGARATFAKVSGSTLTVTFPAKAAGAYDVLVTTPGGTSEKATFTFTR